MSRGIIMELNGNRAVVLTPGGEFKTTRLPSGRYELGQEVEIKKNSIGLPGRLGAIAAVLVIALVLPYLFNSVVLDTRAYAYVDLDINPSVEFTINRQGRIIDVKGLNGEGDKVLENADLTGKSLEYGLEYFTLRAYDLGFAGDGERSYILATTVFEGENDEKLETEINLTLEKVVQKNGIPADTGTLVATKEIKAEADKAGVSSGKYLILLQASEEEVQLDVHDMRTKPAVKAVKEAGSDIRKIVGDVKDSGRDLNELLEKNKEKVLSKTREVIPDDRSSLTADIPDIPVRNRVNNQEDGKKGNGSPEDEKETREEYKNGKTDKDNRKTDDRSSKTRTKKDDEKQGNNDKAKDRDKHQDTDESRDTGKSGSSGNGSQGRDKSSKKGRTSGLAEDIIMQLFD